MRVQFIVDTSASMHFASRRGTFSKIGYASAISAALGYMALRQGDRAGLVVYADAIRAMVNRSSAMGTWRQVVGALSTHPIDQPTDLGRAVDQTLAKITNRCLIAIISDFFVDPDQIRAAFARVRHRGHDLIAFQVVDRDEVEFAFTMAADLPPDGAPYSRERVAAAVATLHPAIEVSDSRYTDWSAVGAPSIIADGGNDCAFVLGEGIAAWRGFDLPVLKYRAMVNGVSAPWLYGAGDKWNSYTQRYATDWHCDLLDVLSDYGASARVSLHEVSAVLGLPGKFGISGAEVAGLVDEGRIEDVRHYCETDVLTTYLVYLRLMMHRGTIGIDGYNAAIADIVAMIEQESGDRPYLNDFMEAWGQASGNAFTL